MFNDGYAIYSLVIHVDDCDLDQDLRFLLSRKISDAELTELENKISLFLSENKGDWNTDMLEDLVNEYCMKHDLGVFYEFETEILLYELENDIVEKKTVIKEEH